MATAYRTIRIYRMGAGLAFRGRLAFLGRSAFLGLCGLVLLTAGCGSSAYDEQLEKSVSDGRMGKTEAPATADEAGDEDTTAAEPTPPTPEPGKE